jgi:hypothetical protein
MAGLGAMVKGLSDDLQYRNSQTTSNLPVVSDPEKTNADLLRKDYDRYVQNFRPFEEKILASVNDTSLIDAVPEDVKKQQDIAAGVQQRNLSRYGGAGLSVAQRAAQNVANQRQGMVSLAGGLNTARINQDAINKKSIAELINIGQGVNRNAMQGMGNAAGLAGQREAAFKGAKAQHHNSMVGLGTMATLAIFGV